MDITGSYVGRTISSWHRVIDGKIYAFGGIGYSDYESSMEVYDPDTDTWTTVTSMPEATCNFGTMIIDEIIYTIGGNTSEILSSVAAYDPDTDTWATLASMTTARSQPQIQSIDGTIFAMGGATGSSGLSPVECYTPASPAIPPASPSNLTATAGDAQVGLSWDAVSGADSFYTVMRATVSGGPYTAVATGLTTTAHTDTEVTNGTTYYYVVVAVNGDGDSGYSNEASATPSPSTPTYNALLRITMVTREIKEYEMDGAQIGDFVAWCDSEGVGNPAYMIEKNHTLGPFSVREEYIVYDKISSFEVLQY